MSLLLNRHVRLSVRPDTVLAAVWRGRWRPTRVAEFEATIDPAQADAEAQATRKALAGLAAKLSIGGARLQVEIADALVHLDVAEGEFAGLSARTLTTIAGACVTELLGEQAGAHQIRWQLQRDERHLLVCALPSRWVDAVVGAATTHRVTVASLQPSFNVQWNHHVGGRRITNAVFAVADGTSALIACVREGVVTAVSNGPWYADRGGVGDSTVDRLLAGVGLADNTKSVTLIDVQVDRLLAGLGVDCGARADFVLVSAGEPHAYLSERWSVRSPWGAST